MRTYRNELLERGVLLLELVDHGLQLTAKLAVESACLFVLRSELLEDALILLQILHLPLLAGQSVPVIQNR